MKTKYFLRDNSKGHLFGVRDKVVYKVEPDGVVYYKLPYAWVLHEWEKDWVIANESLQTIKNSIQVFRPITEEEAFIFLL